MRSLAAGQTGRIGRLITATADAASEQMVCAAHYHAELAFLVDWLRDQEAVFVGAYGIVTPQTGRADRRLGSRNVGARWSKRLVAEPPPHAAIFSALRRRSA